MSSGKPRPSISTAVPERSTSWIQTLWRSQEDRRSKHAPQHLRWDEVLAAYETPIAVESLDEAPGWSPAWFNPYIRQENCLRSVSGVILVLGGNGPLDELARAFAEFDGVIWRLPSEAPEPQYEVILPLRSPVGAEVFRSKPKLPPALLALPGWTLVVAPTDVTAWHLRPVRLPTRPYEVRRLRGQPIEIEPPPVPRKPTLPPAALNSKLASIVSDSLLRDCTGDIAALIRPAIRLVQQGRHRSTKPATGISRLGGLPDLPGDIQWPSYDGLPMQFLCQIDLAAVHDAVGKSVLPSAGMLWFFANRQHKFSCDPEFNQEFNQARTTSTAELLASMCSVIHRDVDKADLTERAYPVTEGGSVEFLAPYLDRHVPVDFEYVDTLPHVESSLVPRDFDTAPFSYSAVSEDYAKELCRNEEEWLLGHFQQGDYVGACGPTDRVLLRFTSHGTALSWGDLDDVYFVISEAHLADGRFDRVTFNCGLG